MSFCALRAASERALSLNPLKFWRVPRRNPSNQPPRWKTGVSTSENFVLTFHFHQNGPSSGLASHSLYQSLSPIKNEHGASGRSRNQVSISSLTPLRTARRLSSRSGGTRCATLFIVTPSAH